MITKITSKAVEADAKFIINVDTVDGLHNTDIMLDGELVLKPQSELTISSGVITIVAPGYYPIDTESNVSLDNLVTINGGTNGDVITLYPASLTRTVLVMHGDGNIALSGGMDMPLAIGRSLLTLRYDGTYWRQTAGPRPVVFGYNLGSLVEIIAGGVYGDIPYLPAAYILGIYGMANTSGNLNIDIQTRAFGSIPNSSHSIGTSPCFVLASQQTKSDLTLSGITREQDAGCWRFIATADSNNIRQIAIVVLGVLL